ncbi:MAG: ATP-binding cassette domain-containing protein [Anaerolineae bacterium]|nr:ATP-binding cassette domain-containing protein [Anaerolineae bacterium]
MPPLIAIENLHHSFADGWDALNGVTLRIDAGEYTALIGPNGSGKTTLAKHLNGLLKPTSGQVLVNGTDTREASVSALARLVGYCFQNPDHQIFCASVREELAFGPTALDLSPGEVTERVEAELAAFGLAGLRERPPAVLPPGLRRRVALASVLTTRPRLLILDEPGVGLDAREQADVFARIAAYNEAGNAVLLISHDMGAVSRYSRRCLLMAAGQLVADGPPNRILCDAGALADAGMQPPTMSRLSLATSDLGLPPLMLSPEEYGRALLRLREERS